MLSVVVSTYKQNSQLKLVLKGLARQTNRNFETIVANDGGDRDGVQSIVDQFDFMNVRHQYLEPPTEVYRACEVRNAGLFAASADRVLFIDGDSIPCERTVEIHSAYIDRTIIVQSNRARIPKQFVAKAKIANLEELTHSLRFPLDESGEEQPIEYNEAWTYSASYPSAVVKAIGGFWEDMRGYFGNDVELNYRLKKIGFKFIVRRDSISFHLGHDRAHDTEEARQLQAAKLKESRQLPTIFRDRPKASLTDKLNKLNKMIEEGGGSPEEERSIFNLRKQIEAIEAKLSK
jgi:glycosyltransferase involved in cell wall biosynthesis